ncbi:hypothetical protein HPB52_002109 [Rhipicephalus sanguineus]|uniref:Uncharacterized protein n=1 Tax=Rhipicephalus sanguineus TaxID=34632 RepID=A0A9D4SU44_RHISA|nr:hypothetical protein HPB52_002109 [Rhipicephalus sanguineus]
MKANVQYNGYHLCSYYFTECAYADLARTRQLLTAVPAVAVEVVSLIDEGPSRAQVTADSAQDHPGQKRLAAVSGAAVYLRWRRLTYFLCGRYRQEARIRRVDRVKERGGIPLRDLFFLFFCLMFRF